MITYNPLWEMLIKKNMTKTQLREKAGFSTVTLSKLSKNEYVSLQIVDNICRVLQVKSIADVVEFLDDQIITTLNDINYLVKKLTEDKKNNTNIDNKDIIMLYLIMEEFITNEMSHETKENVDTFLSLYSKCFQNKLLPPDLIDGINDLLKKQLF